MELTIEQLRETEQAIRAQEGQLHIARERWDYKRVLVHALVLSRLRRELHDADPTHPMVSWMRLM